MNSKRQSVSRPPPQNAGSVYSGQGSTSQTFEKLKRMRSDHLHETDPPPAVEARGSHKLGQSTSCSKKEKPAEQRAEGSNEKSKTEPPPQAAEPANSDAFRTFRAQLSERFEEGLQPRNADEQTDHSHSAAPGEHLLAPPDIPVLQLGVIGGNQQEHIRGIHSPVYVPTVMTDRQQTSSRLEHQSWSMSNIENPLSHRENTPAPVINTEDIAIPGSNSRALHPSPDLQVHRSTVSKEHSTPVKPKRESDTSYHLHAEHDTFKSPPKIPLVQPITGEVPLLSHQPSAEQQMVEPRITSSRSIALSPLTKTGIRQIIYDSSINKRERFTKYDDNNELEFLCDQYFNAN